MSTFISPALETGNYAFRGTLQSLTDVAVAQAPQDGTILGYSAATGKWQSAPVLAPGDAVVDSKDAAGAIGVSILSTPSKDPADDKLVFKKFTGPTTAPYGNITVTGTFSDSVVISGSTMTTRTLSDVSVNAPMDGNVLKWNSAENKWKPSDEAASDTVTLTTNPPAPAPNTNISSAELVNDAAGPDLSLRPLVALQPIQVTTNGGGEVEIGFNSDNFVTAAANVGVAVGGKVFKDLTTGTVNLRTLTSSAESKLTFVTDGDNVRLEPQSGVTLTEFADFANVGADGVGVHAGTDADFRHIAPASSKVTVALTGNDIDVDVDPSQITLADLGSKPLTALDDVTITGTPAVYETLTFFGGQWRNRRMNLVDLQFKNLGELDDVFTTGVSDGQHLAYNSTLSRWEPITPAAAGEVNTTSSAGSGASLVLPKSGVDLPFKSILAGSGISVTPAANELTVACTLPNTLTGLTDTTITAPATGQKLIYDAVNGWENKDNTDWAFGSTELLINRLSAPGQLIRYIGVDNTTANQGAEIWFNVGAGTVDGDDSKFNTALILQNNIASSTREIRFNPNYTFKAGQFGGTPITQPWVLKGSGNGVTNSGPIQMQTESTTTGVSGALEFKTGSVTNSIFSGEITLTTGNVTRVAAGIPSQGVGNITLQCGSALSANIAGGSVILNATAGNTGGNHGQVVLSSATAGDILVEADGTMSTTTSNYENLVTADSDFPNRGFYSNYGQLLWEGNTVTPTVITSVGVAVKLNHPVAVTLLTNSKVTATTTAGGQRLTYQGGRAAVVRLSYSLSMFGESNDRNMRAMIYKNGSRLPGTYSRLWARDNVDGADSCSLSILTSVVNNDYFELFIQNDENTDDATIESCTFEMTTVN